MNTILNNKINPSHLCRKAVIYIRQSSERQVQHHTESTRVQYALSERANLLGWKSPNIIDEDLGKSAGYDSERSGFQRVVAQVGMADVGIVISFEATRLARNNRDWYQLIDLCTIFDTLIGDHQSVYDPKDPNDRLLLGMKGTMSEAELNLIKLRMRQGRLSKARRGALYSMLPPGYTFSDQEAVVKSPDKQEQQAIELIFSKFKELGSARQTFLWFVEENISVPVNCKRDIEGVGRRWQLPKYGFILQLLRNPFYAGAYAYGRSGSRTNYVDGRIKKTTGHLKPIDQWEVLIKDHHEGYISWSRYEEIILTMKNNQNNRQGKEAVGAVRNGKGLLVGLLRCQRCGRKMHVRYWGKDGVSPRYMCPGEFNYGGNYCLSFSGNKTDQVFENELFKVIKPAAIQATLLACDAVGQKNRDKINYLKNELERAQYEADRAFKQYNQVDPLNRLVAGELEHRWNEKLQFVNEIKVRIEEEKIRHPNPSSEEIETIRTLSQRLPEVWRHPDTNPAVKKKIIRMVVEEILIDFNDETLILTMTIHWKGGVHTQVTFKKPVKGDPPPSKTDENIVDLLKKLSKHYPDEEIARILNCHKYKTGAGNPWNRTRVRSLRASNKIAPFDRKKKREVVSLNEASKRLDITTYVVRQLIKKGVIEASQIMAHAPFLIESSELEKESVKEATNHLRSGGRLKNIASIDDRQLSLF
jgi:DNA invertase Pin-like site-specific DNA recombinase